MSPRQISIILWTVNLAAIAASIFSYVYLAYFVYQRTGSAFYSELVLIAPMVIPVVLCLVINRLASSSPPKPLLAVANCAGIAISAATYLLIENYVFVAVAGALLIGFLDAMQRVARTVAIKRYFSTADVKYAVPLTLTAQFIAGAIAGVGLSFFKSEITPGTALAIVTGAFTVAALAAWLLPTIQLIVAPDALSAKPRSRYGALGTLTELLAANTLVRHGFWTFVIFVTIFQGFFNVSRVVLPTHQLNLSQNFVGYLQIISATSALAGALLFTFLAKRQFVFGPPIVAFLSILSLCAMVGSTSLENVFASYFLYFVYMFVWEILFFKYQSDLVAATPQESMPLVATFQYAGVYLGMILAGLIGGFITHYFNLTIAAVAFALVYVVLMPTYSLHGKRALEHEGASA